MNIRIRAFAMGVALAWAPIEGAGAADVAFTITGGGKAVTFELPLNPGPLLNGTNGFAVPNLLFEIFSVSVVVDGVPEPPTDLIFFSTGLGTGGFLADGLFSFSGPQFYTGPESSPTFLTGVYKLRNGFGNKIETVTVIDPPSLAVPEPSTWAMMLVGFSGLAFARYRRSLRTA
jgi:PEP-CTERM motif